MTDTKQYNPKFELTRAALMDAIIRKQYHGVTQAENATLFLALDTLGSTNEAYTVGSPEYISLVTKSELFGIYGVSDLYQAAVNHSKIALAAMREAFKDQELAARKRNDDEYAKYVQAASAIFDGLPESDPRDTEGEIFEKLRQMFYHTGLLLLKQFAIKAIKTQFGVQ